MFSWRALTLLVGGELRAAGRQPGPLLFTIVGIVLATALVVGVDLANSAARKAYEDGFARQGGGVTHTLYATDGVLTDADYVQLRTLWRRGQLPAIRGIAPLVLGSLEIRTGSDLAAAGEGRVLQRELWGIDPLQDGTLRTSTASLTFEARLLARRVAFGAGLMDGVVDARPARSPYAGGNRAAWRSLELRVPAGPAAFGDVLVADIATAQELLDMTGRLTRIDLRLDCAVGAPPPRRSLLDSLFPGLDTPPAPDCAALVLPLPAGLRLVSLAAQRDEDLSAAAAFEFNLGALSLLAAAVAAFLVHQVVVLGVNRQTIALGRLRALGMLGSEIAARLVLGYMTIALFSGLLGVLLGGLLAQALVVRVSAVVNDLFYRSAVDSVSLDPASALKGVAVAVGVALLATVGPAWRIATTAPVLLIRGEVRARAGSVVPWFGLGCLAGVGLLLHFTHGIAGALLAIGLALLATLGLAGRLLPRLRPPAWVPVVPRLALADLERTGRDAGLALGALVIAVATAFGMAWMIDSFRSALEEVLEARLSADLVVLVDAADSARLAQLQALPGVREVALGARGSVEVALIAGSGPGRDAGVAAVAARTGSVDTALRIVDTPAAEARRIELAPAALGPGQVAISEPLAHRLVTARLHARVSEGRGSDTERLALGSAAIPGMQVRVGNCTLRIGGVFREYGSVQGRLTAARSVLAPCLSLPPPTEAEIRGDAPAATVAAALVGARDLLVVEQARVRSVALAIFDRTFAITQVVRWLALLVASIALFASLSIWMSQRAAELGMLRAIGLDARELGAMLALQTLLLGVMAIVLALPLGALIAWILTAELHPRAFGWSFPLHLRGDSIGGTLLAAMLAVLAGAALPVWRLTRAPAVRWLREARDG